MNTTDLHIAIRQAGIDDLDMLMQWRMEVLREVFAIPPNQQTDLLEDENLHYYKEALPSGSHIACFAMLDGKAVGCGGLCLHREMPSPDNPTGCCAYLMNIYARPGFRRCGVGRAIVQWLTDAAANKGITKIYLETSADGRPLYENIGFRDMPNMMQLRPADTSTPSAQS